MKKKYSGYILFNFIAEKFGLPFCEILPSLCVFCIFWGITINFDRLLMKKLLLFSGCFNLDPNRVIDILLESFEMRPDLETYYVPLIKSYVSDKTTLCHVLGFKFQFYKVRP